MKKLFEPLVSLLRGRNGGIVGAGIGLIFGLLLVIFGGWKTLLIILLTSAGYVVGTKFFASADDFRELLDRLFPPGRFR